jgi:hypothetical protein
MDLDPAIFVIDLQDVSKKQIFLHNFFCLLLLKVHLDHFSKIKRQKESQNGRNQGFSYYFCMMIEGSGSRSRAGSGSIPLTSGSGSGWPKNMWIRWIRIRIWIRIRNTALWSGCHDRQAHAAGPGATAAGPTADPQHCSWWLTTESLWSGRHDRQAHAAGPGATAVGPTADHDELPGPA